MKALNPVILDLKGLVENAYHSAKDVEGLPGTVKETVNKAGFGFEIFLSKFFDPLLDICESPIHMIAVVDDGNTYRKSLFPDYKAKRAERRAEQDPLEREQLALALDYAKVFLASIGVPLVQLKGQEADDVIAYLAQNLQGNKLIATIDKDLIALGTDTCKIFRNGKMQESFTDKDVEVPADLVSLYLSFVGDSSDGFPGLHRVGPKGWQSMVEDFGLDGMRQLRDLADANERVKIKAIAQVGGNKVLARLIDEFDTWQLQYRLAKLNPDLCVGAKASLDWYKRVPSRDRLTNIMLTAGLPDLLEKYLPFVYSATLVTMDNLDECLKEIEALLPSTPAVPWDYETYDPVKNPRYLEAARGKSFVDVLNSKITGCSFGFGPTMSRVFYFSVFHKDTNNVPAEVVASVIRKVEALGLDMVAHNVQFEATVTKVQSNHEITCWEDTRAYYHHVDENTENGLKYLSKAYLNYDQTSYAKTLEAAGANDMSEISGVDVLGYGADDSAVTGHLYHLATIITQLEGTYDFIREYECPAIGAFLDPFIGGVKLDADEVAKQTEEDAALMQEKMDLLRSLLREHCINPNLEGVETLYEDQKEYVALKAISRIEDKSPEEKQAKEKDALAKHKQTLKDNCLYVEPYPVVRADEFIPTATKLTKVCELLRLPAIEKVTKSYLSDWLSDVQIPEGASEAAREFVALLPPAIAEFKARGGAYYEPFKALCDRVFYEHGEVEMLGTELNLGSPVQMQALLYLLLGLPIRVRTKVQKKSLRHKHKLIGSPATDAAAIDFALANDCSGENAWKADVLKALKSYTAASTRTSIYWKPWPLWMGEDQLVHPNFTCPGTVTRRPTGSAPNFLQVSKGKVRKCVIPKAPGRVIVSIDFGSQELRVMAALSGDANFLSAYINEEGKDKDLHAMTGCGIVTSVLRNYEGVDPSSLVLSEGLVDYDFFKLHQDDNSPLGSMLKGVRGISKTVNFGVGYGAVGQTVSQQAMIPLEVAEAAVEGFHKAYPGVNKWKAKVFEFARKFGYVATTYGSRRHCGNALNASGRADAGRWERQLANFLIQGQCADLLKVVLATAYRTRLFERFDAQLIAPIYDEILCDVPISVLYEFLHALADLMEVKMPGICVPMVADCSFGPNWYQQIEVGVRPSREKVEAALAEMAAKTETVVPDQAEEFDVLYVESEADDLEDADV